MDTSAKEATPSIESINSANWHGRDSVIAACASCRKLKMRCIRPTPERSADGSIEPCERCARTSRHCSIPERRPLGRKRGATGRYKGVEKALRQIQTQLKKAQNPSGATSRATGSFSGPSELQDPFDSVQLGEVMHEFSFTSVVGSGSRNEVQGLPDKDHLSPELPVSFTASPNNLQQMNSQAPKTGRGTVSNPLALLADASGSARTIELRSESSKTSPSNPPEPTSFQRSVSYPSRGQSVLRRPGFVSLGLGLSNEILETGLDALLDPTDRIYQCINYFRAPDSPQTRDTGPDLDPICLGLINSDEAAALFPVYFARLHPINGILDPELHTPEYVRSRSALLFTWMLAITAQFDRSFCSAAKRLRLHGEKLSKHVHTSGFKSVEIVQGYYISMLSAAPAETIAQERISLYTNHAFGLAAELGLDQRPGTSGGMTSNFRTPAGSVPPDDASITRPMSPNFEQLESNDSAMTERLARNKERTWLRILLWERANNAATGRITSFPETELTLDIERWWMHPYATNTDKYTCAFILLRRRLASLYTELQSEAQLAHSNPHWVLDLVNTSLTPWYQTWLGSSDDTTSPDFLSNVFMRYVYMHGRLWTLSFALHGSLNIHLGTNSSSSADLVGEDCFGAAVHCCEVAVRDLTEIGEPLYCMMAPTWAMLAYAAVLALKLFPSVYGTKPGSNTQLLALLSQVALQMERAGTTPPHRFGIAALLGQHLMMILRTRTAALRETYSSQEQDNRYSTEVTIQQQDAEPFSVARYNNNHSIGFEGDMGGQVQADRFGAMLSAYDPFLTAPGMGMQMDTEGDLMEEGFTDILRDLFGQGFTGIL